ncbi:MAG TPA: gephyrin-like molybdotransferase Glp [Verrucomicrobiae bacterium]|nr:gephyrin-like molybdotransferase Glp [Verrucomicrobiae bacterium]
MLELEDAIQRILSRLPASASERIPLPQADGRYLAQGITAPLNLPGFNNSSMDGYAVRASDIAQAAKGSPVHLRVVGRVAAGQHTDLAIQSGEAMRVFTGSMVPAGADAVVMQEDSELDPATPDLVSVCDSAKPWENVRFQGEDVERGAEIARKGEQLNAGRIALLAALGVSEVEAGRRPRVAVLATGSELHPAGEPLPPGGIYESNRAALASLVARSGGIAEVMPIVPDDPHATRSALKRAFAANDLVITCGGVSVGELDLVKSAFEELGGRQDFWKVAIKPGRPFVFGEIESRFLFGLPGNPVSAFVTFLLLVRPALLRWQGAIDISLEKIRARLAQPVSNGGDRRHFLRVQLTAHGEVHAPGLQASHALSSLAEANALLEVPPRTTVSAGTEVTVLRWD